MLNIDLCIWLLFLQTRKCQENTYVSYIVCRPAQYRVQSVNKIKPAQNSTVSQGVQSRFLQGGSNMIKESIWLHVHNLFQILNTGQEKDIFDYRAPQMCPI